MMFDVPADQLLLPVLLDWFWLVETYPITAIVKWKLKMADSEGSSNTCKFSFKKRSKKQLSRRRKSTSSEGTSYFERIVNRLEAYSTFTFHNYKNIICIER